MNLDIVIKKLAGKSLEELMAAGSSMLVNKFLQKPLSSGK